MEGRITAISDVTVTVMGLELQRGAADFSGLQVGDEVEVEYILSGGSAYEIVEIEAED